MKYRKFLYFILLGLGIFSIYQSYSFFIGSEDLLESGVGCRAICGLALLVDELFGATAARCITSFLLLMAGVFLVCIPFSGSKYADE